VKVPVHVIEDELDGDYGPVAGLRLACSRCGHEVEVFGTEGSSARRGALMLREQCPNNENNFYSPDWPD
jgi:hypothetical protein